MDTVTVAYTNFARSKRPLGRTIAIFAKETKYEFLKLLRARAFSIATIGFPVMFYVLFGVIGGQSGSQSGGPHARYMLAGYACFGLIGSALFGVGVGMAGERGQGWLELKRSSPMPPPAYLFAKALTAGAFGLIILCVLTAIGLAFGGLQLTSGEFAHMALVAWLGSLPFAAMGMLLGLTMPAAAATGIVNLIYLPLSYCSGLWIPLPYLPRWIRKVAPASPMYHLVQLMQSGFHDGYRMSGTLSGHILWLACFTLVMFGGGWAVFHRAERNA